MSDKKTLVAPFEPVYNKQDGYDFWLYDKIKGITPYYNRTTDNMNEFWN